MRFVLKSFAVLLLVFAAAGPTVAGASQPACEEYCYDPIPGPGKDKDNPDKPGGTVPKGNGPDGTGQGPAGNGPISKADRIAGKLNVDRTTAKRDAGKGGKNGKNGKDGTDRSRGELDEQEEEALLATGGGGTDPPTSGDSSAGGSSTPLLLMLGLTTLLMLGVLYLRRSRGEESNAGMFVRIGAFCAMLLFLFLAGSGSALAAKNSNAPAGFYGMMNIGAINDEDAERMAAGGVSTYRMPFSWDSVESSRGEPYNWISIDPSVAAAAKAGLKVLPILAATPRGYAGQHTVLPVRNAVQKQGWKRYLRAVVARYGPRGAFWEENPELPRRPIRTWQIWNEANFHYFAAPVAPAQYLKVLKMSYRVLKAVDPNSRIVLSGLYGSPKHIPRRAMKSFHFLNQLYRLKAARFFDAVAVHPYTPNTRQLRLLLTKVRRVMVKNRDGRTPLHVTEIGWGSDRKTVFGMGTPAKQARQLTSGYRMMLNNRKKLNLRSAYWFAWRDVPADQTTCNFCYSSGLFHPTPDVLKPKPAWNAFVRLTGGTR